jgi:hypothetical protein
LLVVLTGFAIATIGLDDGVVAVETLVVSLPGASSFGCCGGVACALFVAFGGFAIATAAFADDVLAVDALIVWPPGASALDG